MVSSLTVSFITADDHTLDITQTPEEKKTEDRKPSLDSVRRIILSGARYQRVFNAVNSTVLTGTHRVES